MTPKTIHYCWFGGKPLPKSAVKYMESWRKNLPGWEIKEWSESNFDVNMTPYTKDAYAAGKYAFVSDFARFWILHKYGGIYFDVDVEVVRPMQDIIDKGAFMGMESDGMGTVNAGLGLACAPGMKLYKEILELYEGLRFENLGANEKTVVAHITGVLQKYGLEPSKETQEIGGIYIYPSEYFCPIDPVTMKKKITENTRTIHHYDASWVGHAGVRKALKRILPRRIIDVAKKAVRK
jgi:hypothetical protein